jgi:hypothetical protein
MDQTLIAPAAAFTIAFGWLVFSLLKRKNPSAIDPGEVSHSWLVAHRGDRSHSDR